MESERDIAALGQPSPTGAPAARRLRALLNRDGGTARKLGVDALDSQLKAGFARGGAVAELAFVPGAELSRKLEEALNDAQAGRARRRRGRRRRRQRQQRGRPARRHRRAAGRAAAGHAQPFRPRPRHAARARGGRGRDRHGGPRAVDVAEVNGQVFVNNSRARRLPLHGGRPRAPARAARAGQMARHGAGLPAHAGPLPAPPADAGHSSGDRLPVRTPALLVGVNDYDPQGFAVRRAGARPGRAVRRAGAATGPAELRLVRLPLRLQRPRRFARLRGAQAESLEVRARTSRLPVATDGELLRLRPPLRFRIRPGELLVLAPAAEV